MIKPNTIFFDGRKVGTYESVLTAGSGHIEFNGFKPCELQLNENQQIVIDLEMSDCSVEVTGWNYPEELDTENLSYLFSNVLENARALEQEEE